MSSRTRSRPAFVLLVGLSLPGLAACGDNLAGLAAGPSVILDPGERGPFDVGVETYELVDDSRIDPVSEAGPRRFSVEVWYPAEDHPDDVIFDRFDLADDAPPDILDRLGDFRIAPMEQRAVRDAPPRRDQGRFPVVVFSHGNGAIRYQSFSLTTHLASHGYVVVAPDHPGNTLFHVPPEEDIERDRAHHAVERPQDVSFVVDQIDAGAVFDRSLVDLDRVAVSGHSFGGFTSLLVANPFSSFYDPRIDAVVALSPATTPLELLGGPVELLEVPTLYLSGKADATTVWDVEVLPAYQTQTSTKGLVGLSDTGHLGFADFCDPALLEAAMILEYDDYFLEGLRDGCGPSYAPAEEVHRLANYYATGWLNVHVRDSQATWERYLTVTPPSELAQASFER